MINVNVMSTEEEFQEVFNELIDNEDFSFMGDYTTIQSVIDVLVHEVGLDDEQIETMSNEKYGDVLEILDFQNNYYCFVGMY